MNLGTIDLMSYEAIGNRVCLLNDNIESQWCTAKYREIEYF